MTKVLVRLLAGLAFLSCLSLTAPAAALPGFPDCKEAPTAEAPGRGMAGFFSGAPDELPVEADPFSEGAETTIFEQYGYAGLRWNTYDLGCGPDAMRHPDAVIGTAISNWLVQMPIALTALTGAVTQVAFAPDFLGGFDGAVGDVSSALHENLFASWIPFVVAAIGVLIIFKARKASLATSAAAVGWALIVILIATALFRWPIEAGRAADATVTGTLGAVVSKVDGNGPNVDPGTAVASNVSESIFYEAWLAGTFGTPDSQAARTHGPELFKAQALTWREAQVLEQDPEAGQEIIERKKEAWKEIAEKVENEDPEAYEYLRGVRSDTRIGYSVLATVAAFLALPFLLLSALLLVGCFLIVRLGVMLFPAFATLGAFPASRGLVIGLGRTVGAAVVNAIIFGIGAGVTIAVLGVLFHPGGGAPGWLGIVLMPLFSAVMWVALKPFRRLTSMASPDDQHFGHFEKPSWLKRVAVAGASAVTGGAAAGITASAVTDDKKDDTQQSAPERAEARSSYDVPPTDADREETELVPAGVPTSTPEAPGPASPQPSPPPSTQATPVPARPMPEPMADDQDDFTPQPIAEPVEPVSEDELDDDELFEVYRPSVEPIRPDPSQD